MDKLTFDNLIKLPANLLVPQTPAAPARAAKAMTFDDLVSLPKSLLTAAPGTMAATSYKSPVWDASEAIASRKTGVPVEVLSAIRLAGERSNGNQVSPKGARGVYQFIPSTRDAFLKKYGVDAYSNDPNEQAMATAWHLKESHARSGDWVRAMAGFNGGISGERGTNRTQENRDYVKRTSGAIGRPVDSLKTSAIDNQDMENLA